MLQLNTYEYVCLKFDEIPEKVASSLRPEIYAALGKPVSLMFPAFAKAFPLTVKAMEVHWSKPIAVFRQGMKYWLPCLLLQRPDANLYFDLTFPEVALDGPDFDSDHAMLPSTWHELYRWFWSFGLTKDSIQPLIWDNTLSSFTGRLSFAEYCSQKAIDKEKARDFVKKIGSKQLMCWLRTDGGDALFLDEMRCDHKVYHVKGADLDDVCVLQDSAKKLDDYLAHYLSGGKPADFNFRS